MTDDFRYHHFLTIYIEQTANKDSSSTSLFQRSPFSAIDRYLSFEEGLNDLASQKGFESRSVGRGRQPLLLPKRSVESKKSLVCFSHFEERRKFEPHSLLTTICVLYNIAMASALSVSCPRESALALKKVAEA